MKLTANNPNLFLLITTTQDLVDIEPLHAYLEQYFWEPQLREIKMLKGIKVEEIRLGACQPKENRIIFDDALNKLQNELSYLYSEDDRYWYDTRPTLKKLENDRANQLEETELNNEIEKRLRKCLPSFPFSKLHICPAGPGEVQDTNQGMRMVILRPEDNYNNTEKETCKVIIKAKEILNNCEDNKPRTYKIPLPS